MELALVGVSDGELDPNQHRSSFLTNKVGGAPDLLPGIVRPRPLCARCGGALVHVVQVYCPLDVSRYHRNLHLFACAASACAGGPGAWTALRSQGLQAAADPPPVPEHEAPLTAADWCESADDWGEEEEEDAWRGGEGAAGVDVRQAEEEAAAPEEKSSTTDVSSRLQDLSLDESQEQDDSVPVLRPFFISVVDESDLCGGEEAELLHAHQLLREYEQREGVAVGQLDTSEEGGGGEEKYEKTNARHGDAVFSRFMKKISVCPQQILRYCRGSKPLFIVKPPSNMAQAVPACSSCGGARTFELQLMPALVSLLQRKDGSCMEAELEFGTVLVYTCTSSCWTAGSRSTVDEFCFVQTDPDQQLFK